jgi:hypothetical protein
MLYFNFLQDIISEPIRCVVQRTGSNQSHCLRGATIMATRNNTTYGKNSKECCIAGCGVQAHSREMCQRHYRQVSRYGEIRNTHRKGFEGKNLFITDNECTFIILEDRYGHEKERAIIDTEDLERVSQYKWSLSVLNGHKYAKRNWGPLSMLHQYILHFKGDRFVQTDHKNRNGLDCRKSNLRIATRSQNVCNTGIRSDNLTGYRGVHFVKDRNYYRAVIQLNGSVFYLGSFQTAEEAALAYNKRAIDLHGEFASLNMIEGI